MSQIALFVDFEIYPEQINAFNTLIRNHAAGTLAEEAGCLTFAIGVDQDAPTHYWLYELYEDIDALEFHRNSSRLIRFREERIPMCKSMRVVTTDVVTM